jgi:hypothetical protein
MLIRIFKSSVLLGVLSLFFFPATIVALVRNWNDPDTDIKIPFFLSLIFSGIMAYSIYTTVASVYEEQIMWLSDADISELSDGDPQMAAMLRRQRDELRREYGWDGSEESGEVDLSALRVSIEAERESSSDNSFAPLTEATQQRLGYEAAANTIKFQRGTARFESARVELAMPQHFRFVAVDQLEAQARVRERELAPGTFGWIVHERVDMGLQDAWWIEVRFHADGHVGGASDLAGQLGGNWQDGALTGLDAAFQPRWNPSLGVATWVEARPDGRFDVQAGLPLRHGVLRFGVPAMSSKQLELGLRAARLMAARGKIDRGWRAADFEPGRDKSAGMALGEWIASYRPAPLAAVDDGNLLDPEEAPEQITESETD